MPVDRTHGQAVAQSSRTGIPCPRCREILARSGWCETCTEYPKTVHPWRLGNCGHSVDTAGFCWSCLNFTGTGLILGRSGWTDTGRVSVLLPRAESQRRIAELDRILARQILDMAHQPEHRDIEAEKRALLTIVIPAEDEVPF